MLTLIITEKSKSDTGFENVIVCESNFWEPQKDRAKEVRLWKGVFLTTQLPDKSFIKQRNKPIHYRILRGRSPTIPLPSNQDNKNISCLKTTKRASPHMCAWLPLRLP